MGKQPNKKKAEEDAYYASLIYRLAVRLPWIVVLVVLLTVLFTILQAYFSR